MKSSQKEKDIPHGITYESVKLLVAQSCPTVCDPMDCSPQVPLSMEFSRQEYWSGLPFLSPRGLPDPGIEPGSPAFQADTLTSKPPRKPMLALLGLYWGWRIASKLTYKVVGSQFLAMWVV